MNKRLEKFEALSIHPWQKRNFAKLKSAELSIARDFLKQNADLDRGAFELKINRMFIDREKPKNWTVILELLANANSGV